MKILRPITVSGAVLASSSVPLPVVTGSDPDPALWVVGTTYALDAEVYVGERRYRSRQTANTGHAPATSADWWLDIGPVNRLAMFDQSLGTTTSAAEQITVTLAPTGYADALSIMGAQADTVRVQVVGSPYDTTEAMMYPRPVSNMYEYRFEPFESREKVLFTGLPIGPGAQITVTLSKPGGTAVCGMCVPGMLREFGGTEYGLTAGIKDFGKKGTDQWGKPTLLEGAWADRMTISVMVPNHLIDALKRELTRYRSVPVVWVASSLFELSQVYGTFRDFSIVIAYPTYSKCSIEIEGFA